MARIKQVEIRNFRGIRELVWNPLDGVNCIVGTGDSGKTTLLEAIDYGLGLRRSTTFNDADFFNLDVGNPIEILITVGDLPTELKDIEAYGLYHRSFDSISGVLFDEPVVGLQNVLTVKLTVTPDLEPSWALFSIRAAADGQTKMLKWDHRAMLTPTRLGSMAENNLSWRKGSLLHKLSDETADASSELAAAVREARSAFGDTAKEQVKETLDIVNKAAKDLGISAGEITALLDAQSVSLTGGTISLHGENGVPLRCLGLGSTRLLVTGLQRQASQSAAILVIDEVEQGLEPHRIHRLLSSLGVKSSPPEIQVFMTTHSPVVLKELSINQLWIMRTVAGKAELKSVGACGNVQGTMRACPEAFLAKKVLVCEGASEVGFIRGIDQYFIDQGMQSMSARGVATADGGGNNTFTRAQAFIQLGFTCAILRDTDKPAPAIEEQQFKAAGGVVFQWDAPNALEEELFASVPSEGIGELLDAATSFIGADTVEAHIKTFSMNTLTADVCKSAVTPLVRATLAKASKKGENGRKAGWFKSISAMETVAREIIGPRFRQCRPEFQTKVGEILTWTQNAG